MLQDFEESRMLNDTSILVDLVSDKRSNISGSPTKLRVPGAGLMKPRHRKGKSSAWDMTKFTPIETEPAAATEKDASRVDDEEAKEYIFQNDDSVLEPQGLPAVDVTPAAEATSDMEPCSPLLPADSSFDQMNQTVVVDTYLKSNTITSKYMD